MARLRLTGDSLVSMDKGTFMWVHVHHFAVDEAGSDRQVLEALMATPAYQYDYASPFDAEEPDRGLHACWRLDALDAGMFGPADADSTRQAILKWATDQEWTQGYTGPSYEVLFSLESDVFGLLESGTVYELDPPTDGAAVHSYGSVVGSTGYHEYVVIDAASSTAHLIVASDD